MDWLQWVVLGLLTLTMIGVKIRDARMDRGYEQKWRDQLVKEFGPAQADMPPAGSPYAGQPITVEVIKCICRDAMREEGLIHD
jgi:hypothetical protein